MSVRKLFPAQFFFDIVGSSDHVQSSNPDARRLRPILTMMRRAGTGAPSNLISPTRDENALIQKAVRDAQNSLILDLSCKGLSSVPPSSWSIMLQELDLNHNRFTALPDGIVFVGHALRKLDLSHNCLVSLHPSIGQLRQLTQLLISRNPIRELPAEIGLLSSLQSLHADHCKLVRLPRELAACTKLLVLDLQYNQLTELPPSFYRLSSLGMLLLEGNPLQSPPRRLIRHTAAVLSYLREHCTPEQDYPQQVPPKKQSPLLPVSPVPQIPTPSVERESVESTEHHTVDLTANMTFIEFCTAVRRQFGGTWMNCNVQVALRYELAGKSHPIVSDDDVKKFILAMQTGKRPMLRISRIEQTTES